MSHKIADMNKACFDVNSEYLREDYVKSSVVTDCPDTHSWAQCPMAGWLGTQAPESRLSESNRLLWDQ